MTITLQSISDIKRLALKSPKKKEAHLEVGTRVRVSRIGRASLRHMPIHSQMGVVAEPLACYPGSISVRRDGAKKSKPYHASYWEAA